MNDLQPQIAWIGRLVAFDTTSRESNLPLIEDVESYLSEHGVSSTRVANAEKTKANLHFSIGPQAPGGVILSGHTDVVPVDGQDWATDPWTVAEKDGKLYGRGTADMKSFSAIALSLLPEMLAADLKRPIHFALSYDEEIGLLGAPAMIADMRAALPGGEVAIVGEPTDMTVVDGQKGVAMFRTVITGHEGHSSAPAKGVSAVMRAARLIAFLERLSRERAEAGDASSTFDPPYATITANVIEGGTASNIMAGRCAFVWDIRATDPSEAEAVRAAFDAYASEVEAEMKRVSPVCAIVTETLADAPPMVPQADNRAADLARALTGENRMRSVSYAAESGQFQGAGYPTVICGPGSIDQAHQPNEFITLEQVAKGTAFIRKLIERLST